MHFWSSLLWRLLGRVPCLRRRVWVNLVDGDAIEGVLWQHVGAWLVVKQAAHITADGKTKTSIDGDVVIECAKVAFIQASVAS